MAGDILNALLTVREETGAMIMKGMAVKSVTTDNGQFIVKTESDIFTARFLIIATGGKSYPSTGSTGDGYRFAEALGHTIVEPRPALAAVVTESYELTAYAGNSFPEAEISLWRDSKRIRSFSGDLLLTHNGLFGASNTEFFKVFQKWRHTHH